MTKHFSECYFKYNNMCTLRKNRHYNKLCKECKDFFDIPKSAHDVKSKEIRKVFRMIVRAFEEAGYKSKGGGEELEMYISPRIKIFVRDIKDVDTEPFIMIRGY